MLKRSKKNCPIWISGYAFYAPKYKCYVVVFYIQKGKGKKKERERERKTEKVNDWKKKGLNDELKNKTGISHFGVVFSLFNKIIQPTTNVDFTRETSPHYHATNKLIILPTKMSSGLQISDSRNWYLKYQDESRSDFWENKKKNNNLISIKTYQTSF